MPQKRRKIKVVYKKLGKEKVWGLAELGGDSIEMDPRLKGKKHLEILIHEALHILHPKLSEEIIMNNSICLTNLIWGERYKRVEEDSSEPLQDGRQ